MSILLIQLSDAHFAGPTDELLGRVGHLAGAIVSEADNRVDAVHLLLTGDATQSGESAQFVLAERFIGELRGALAASLKTIPVELLVVPGNHDCDFTGDQTMRDLAINNIATLLQESGLPSEKATAELLGPLAEYFNFAERVSRGAGHSLARPYYTCVDKRVGDVTLRYHLFNTAWMSRRGESPGSLYFPLEAVVPPSGAADVSICMLHHPFNWFKQPAALRPLREKVEALGDLILSAHEHVGLVYGKEIHGSGGMQYVEGAVLQERGRPEVSGFHVIRIEPEGRRFGFSTYSWTPSSSAHYGRKIGPVTVNWEPVAARTNKLKLTPRFEQYLDDPGLPVHHRTRGSLKLSQYYTFPDLGSLDDDAGTANVRVRGDHVVQSLIERERVIVAAPDKAGRTSFGKRLFVELHAKGYAPLLLRGEKLPRSARSETLREKLHECVRDQYESLLPAAYDQLPRSKRVLILDDLHKGPRSRAARDPCLKDLDTWFGRVVLLTNTQSFLDELLVTNAEAAHPSQLESYSLSLILPFGYGRCDRFIRQWVALSPGEDEATIDDRVRQIMSTVGDVLNTTAIPHYPWVMLVLVQMADSPEPPAAGNGSYSHLLNAIITAALNRSRVRRLPVNGMYGYLGELARTIFESGKERISEGVAREFHAAYIKAVGISALDFGALIDDLCEAAIIERSEGEISFQHKYTFCFFVAWSLAQRLNDNDPSAFACVERLSHNLFQEDSADVIVFLANLTSNRLVLDEIKKRAVGLFKESNPSDLASDVQPINQLTKAVRRIVIPDSDPEHNRRRLGDQQDDLAAKQNTAALDARKDQRQAEPSEEAKQTAAYNGAMQFASAVRTIEILGQVLRNESSVRKLDEKCKIAEEIFLLARRMLGFLFANVSESFPPLITRLEQLYRARFPEYNDQDIANEVSEHIFNLAWFSTFAVVKHVAATVGDENLEDTFRQVLGGSKSVANSIFDLAIRLDQPQSTLPITQTAAVNHETNKNHLAQAVLRSLVAEHLYLYKVREPEKQSICSILDITLSKRFLDPKEKKLLT